MTFDPDPNRVIPTVIAGAVNALKAAFAEPSVKRFVYTSSSTAAMLPKLNVPGIVVTENTWNDEAVKLAWSSTTYSAEQASLTYAASKTQAEQEVWKFYNENKHKRPDLVVNTDCNFGKSLDVVNQGHPSTSGFIVFLWQNQNLEILKQFEPRHFVDVQDTGILHVAAAVHPNVKDERIFGFAETFNWDKVLDILRKQNPGVKFIANFQSDQDLSEIKPKARAEQLLRDLGRPGWTSLEDGILMNTEDLRQGNVGWSPMAGNLAMSLDDIRVLQLVHLNERTNEGSRCNRPVKCRQCTTPYLRNAGRNRLVLSTLNPLALISADPGCWICGNLNGDSQIPLRNS
ncbi:hypothetical protein AUP68_16946 [Ilyonectria robusta]